RELTPGQRRRHGPLTIGLEVERDDHGVHPELDEGLALVEDGTGAATGPQLVQDDVDIAADEPLGPVVPLGPVPLLGSVALPPQASQHSRPCAWLRQVTVHLHASLPARTPMTTRAPAR